MLVLFVVVVVVVVGGGVVFPDLIRSMLDPSIPLPLLCLHPPSLL